MQHLTSIVPEFWAITILSSATIFSFLWFMDAKTHTRIAKTNITDAELQTHRILIISSVLMELSLLAAFWFGWMALPFFIAFFITRTAHEFIDEMHFHVGRCTPRETMLHFGMWVSVLTKTATLFIWAFVLGYSGLLDLSWMYGIWAIMVVASMMYTSYVEWMQVGDGGHI